jgi:hypothetical protein
MLEICHQKAFGYIINIYFKFSKRLEKVYDTTPKGGIYD